MTRKLVGLVLTLMVIGGFAWALWPRPLAVETAQIGRQTIEVHVAEEGKGRIREVYTVSTPIAGTVRRLNLHAGDDVVAEKTVIAAILPSPPSLLDARTRQIAEAAVRAAEAGVALASAQLDQAGAQRDFAKAEAERAKVLLDREAISARGRDKAQLDFLAAEAAVQSAQASLDLRQRELESARAALIEDDAAEVPARCCAEVRAPINGRVLRVMSESEQVVPAGTPLVELGDPSDLEIVVDLLSADAVRVRPGAAAAVDGWGGSPLAARVRKVDPSAFTRVSALGIEEQRVTVLLDLLGDPLSWKNMGDGYRVTARITVWQGRGLLAVPVGALFRSGPDWAVYLARDGRAKFQRIVIGERNDSFAEVRSGLEAGDTVILHPSDAIAEGVAITSPPPS